MAAGAVFLSMLTLLGVQTLRLSWAHTATESVEASLLVCNANTTTQNQAIDTWKQQALNQENRAKEANVRALQVEKAGTTRVAAVLKQPTPQTCVAAIAVGSKRVRDRLKSWSE